MTLLPSYGALRY